MRLPLQTTYVAILAVAFFAVSLSVAYAATLKLTPDTGVYTVGGTFSARVVVNTAGKPINAAEGTLTYNPKELQVVSVSKGASIFNLWTIEPSASGGKISFGGGSPAGYTGAAGTVVSVTFKPLMPGTPKVTFSTGSVLAADGQGTNVLSAMTGGTYTVSAASTEPAPEYVAPANTPAAPAVTSVTHPDPEKWYTERIAKLSWSVPAGVTAVRTLVGDSRSTVPTIVYEPAIREKEITDLDGVSYFHIQMRNAEGWGRVTHYRLAVDAERPEKFDITLGESESGSSKRKLVFSAIDKGSGIEKYMIQIDGGERTEWIDVEKKGIYELPVLGPGDHTVVVEALDYAGNGLVSSISFPIVAFDAPRFTDYPSEIAENIIPVVKGATQPNAKVFVMLTKVGTTENGVEREVQANDKGEFTYVAEGRLALGTYELTARAIATDGSESNRSDAIRIAVQESRVTRIGGTLLSILSVIVPLVGLVVLLILLVMHGWYRAKRLRARLFKEVGEAEKSLAREFEAIVADLSRHVEDLKVSKQGKMTKSGITLLNSVAREIVNAERRVAKEIEDIERAIGK